MKAFFDQYITVFILLVSLALGGLFLLKGPRGENSKSPSLKEDQREGETITMYSKQTCIYCLRAKNYLKERGLSYKEIDLADNPEAYAELSKLITRVTVPQIFIGDYHVGGYSDLIKLEDEELEKLLYPEGK